MIKSIFKAILDFNPSKERIAFLKDQIAALKSEIAALKDQIAALKSENNALKSENNELKAENNELKSENNELRSEIAALKAENNALKAENNELKSENNELKSENNELKSENKGLKSENKELKIKLSNHETNKAIFTKYKRQKRFGVMVDSHGDYFCTSCLMDGIESPLTASESGWRCERTQCNKFYENPDWEPADNAIDYNPLTYHNDKRRRDN